MKVAPDTWCTLCLNQAADVGPLKAMRVTLQDGQTAIMDLCACCEQLARLGIEHPGESYGAAALPDQFAAIEPIAPRVVSAMPCGMSESELVAAYETHAAPMVSEAELTPLARPRGAR